MNEPMFTLDREGRNMARRLFAELPAPPAAKVTLPSGSEGKQAPPLLTALSPG